MQYTKAGKMSYFNRKATEILIDEYNKVPELLQLVGLPDRRIEGILLDRGNHVKLWQNLPSVDDNCEIYVCDLVSRTNLKNGVSSKFYQVGAEFEKHDADLYVLKRIGTEMYANPHGKTIRIGAHSCGDDFWQNGLKGISTSCAHICGILSYLPRTLDANAKSLGENTRYAWYQTDSPFGTITNYSDSFVLPEGEIQLYQEIKKHSNIKAWEKLKLLFEYERGNIPDGSWQAGRKFKCSVSEHLQDERIERLWAKVFA